MTKADHAFDTAWADLTAPGARYEVAMLDVRGSRVRAFRNGPTDLRQLWAGTLRHAERPYLVYDGQRISYGEAHAQIARIAAWLERRGVLPGDRVAIAMRNYPEWLLIYWACVSMGVCVVGMNAWWVAHEMAHAIDDASPKVIFCDIERLTRLAERPGIAGDTLVVAVRAPCPDGVVPWSEVVAEPGTIPTVAIDPDDDACIFYTSGTTGTPKGARLTHRGCANNLSNIAFATEVHALAAARLSGAGEPSEPTAPISLVTTPLFHVTANNCQAHPVTAAGGVLVLMRKWDAGDALRLIHTERITHISGVPTMARELVHHPDAGRYDLSSLRVINGGGAQLPPDLVATIGTRAAPSTGYGMTEASGTITASVGVTLLDRPNSCGRALPTFGDQGHRRRRPGCALRDDRRAARQGGQRRQGLFEPARRDGRDARRWMAANRRHRSDR